MQEDRSLCPVRAVRFYLDKTKELRVGRKKLFVAYKKGYGEKDIHPSTISSWLKETIIKTYETMSGEEQRLTGVKAHQVRGMAASWALYCNTSMESIMQACTWKAHNTFTQYYLKDLSLIRDEMYQLGPVVAAQQCHSA